MTTKTRDISDLLDANGDVKATHLDNAPTTTINNNADNRLITGSGSANTLEGEAKFTFDGTTAHIDSTDSGNTLHTLLKLETDGTTDGSGITIDTRTAHTKGEINFLDGTGSFDGNYVFKLGQGSALATPTEIMRISSSGKVGIGETSPDTNLHVKKASSGSETAFTNSVITLENDTDCRLQFLSGSSNVGEIMFGDGNLNRQGRLSYDHSSDAMKFETTNAERMRIDSSGNVGIGEDVPEGKLHVFTGDASVGPNAKADEGVFESNGHSGISILSGNTSDGNIYFGDSGDDDIGFITYAHGSDNLMQFGTNGAERMRIDSSGNINLSANIINIDNSTNTATGVGIGSSGVLHCATAPGVTNFVCQKVSGSGNQTAFVCLYGSSNVGSIQYTPSSTSFNTSSDYRLKENVDYTFDATTRLKELKPARFNFKADANTTVDGFLAHEVSNIVPEAISGTKDAVDSNGDMISQQIDQSKLVPLLVKTIQELEARITELENA